MAAAKAAVENGAFEAVPQVRRELSSALPPQVAAELARGNKIKAIKLLRQATGLGLKEAKDAVDAAEKFQSPEDGCVVPGVEPNWSIVTIGLWMVGIAFVLAAFWYFRLR